MKLYSWNVNGIRAVIRKDVFLPFIEEHDPDILCLQETKASRDQVVVDLPQYHEYWNSAVKKGYSGTAIFSKEKPLSVVSDIPAVIAKKFPLEDNYGDTNSEGRVLVAEYDKYYVSTVYTPNAKENLSRLPMRELAWDKAFLAYMIKLEKKKPVMFCGDLNVAHKEIDLANPKGNKGKKGFTDEERQGFTNFVDAKYVDSFRHFYPEKPEMYSWWSNFAKSRERNMGWRIDYWMVSQSLIKNVTDAKIHADVMGSDHCPVSIEIK